MKNLYERSYTCIWIISLNSKGGFQQSSDIIVSKAFNIANNTSPVEKYHVNEGIHKWIYQQKWVMNVIVNIQLKTVLYNIKHEHQLYYATILSWQRSKSADYLFGSSCPISKAYELFYQKYTAHFYFILILFFPFCWKLQWEHNVFIFVWVHEIEHLEKVVTATAFVFILSFCMCCLFNMFPYCWLLLKKISIHISHKIIKHIWYKWLGKSLWSDSGNTGQNSETEQQFLLFPSYLSELLFPCNEVYTCI